MANTDAIRDANRVTVGLANSSTGTRPLFIDPVTGRLEVELYAIMTGGSLNLDRALHDANHVATMTGLSDVGTPFLIDSYTTYTGINFVFYSGVAWSGQSFVNPSSTTLDSASFNIGKAGSPTGSATAYIYAITGTMGVNSKPTGAILATSDTFDVSTLTGTLAYRTFTFSGPQRITLNATTNYGLVLRYPGGDAANNVEAGVSNNVPASVGNIFQTTDGVVWSGFNSNALDFKIFGAVANPNAGPLAAASNPTTGYLLVDLLQE